MRVRLLRREPHRRRLLRSNHQVDVVLGTQAVRDGAQEAVGVRRQVNARKLRLEIENGTDEAWILMREAIVLLAGPSRCLDIVQGADVLTPRSFVRLDRIKQVNNNFGW